MPKLTSLRSALAALLIVAGASTPVWSEDIDIYTDIGASAGVPNVLFVIDTGANFSSSAAAPCTSYASSPGEAPSLGNTAGGIEQCALVDAIAALPVKSDGSAAVNVGLLVNNNNNFATDTRAAADLAYHETCSGTYGGCVIRLLAPMTAANKAALINFIKSWKTSGSNSASQFNVKSGGDRTANMMQEAWAYFNGKVGMSGKNYQNSVLASGCQKNFVIFIGNAFNNSGTPADTGAESPYDGTNAMTSSQVNATAAQKAVISETAKFATLTCGVSQFAADTTANGWTSNWADEWARLMYQQDGGSSTAEGRQSIVTYTIGVVNDASCKPDYPALLTTMAKYGGGKYYKTSNSTDLTFALQAVLNEIQAVNSVFSSASLPVSVNAQGTYLNQVFLGMFRPDAGANPRWLGNLKQYQFILVGTDPLTAELQLGDATGASAISSAGTGFISPNALSFWTTDSATSRDPALSGLANGFFANDTTAPTGRNGFDSPDGELVERGGAAERLRIENLTATFAGAATAVGTSTNPRRLYTYCSADSVCAPATPSTDLTAAVNEFSTANANLPAVAFGDSTTLRITQITRSGTTATATTVGSHGFASGSTVTISNASEASYNGSKTLISASGNTFTFAASDFPTTPSQGAYTFSTVGAGSFAVTSMSRGTSGTASNTETVTVTTSSAHPFTGGSTVTIAGATPSSYNGNWTIALPGTGACPAATCFTFSIPVTPNATASGFSAVVAPSSVTISTITSTGNSGTGGTGNVATVTTAAAHGFHQGQRITITNSGNNKYNASNVQVVTVVSSTSFTYQGYANGAPATASGGSASPSATAVTGLSLSRTSNALSVTATATGAPANAFGRVSGNTKVLNITKTGATASETAYTGSNITITCQDNGCTNFTYTITTSPAQPTGTITAAPPSGGSVTIAAGNITRSGSTATVTGSTTNLFGTTAGQTTTVNVSVSGTAFANESAYLGNGSLAITCQNDGCTSFTYTVVQTPALSVSDPNMQAFQAGTAPAKDPLITWVRGQDNFGDELGPGGTVTVRPSIHGDVLHSRPVVINYGDSARGIVAYYGANDGVFRAVNANKTTGNINGIAPGGELWGLILPEHFSQLNRLRINSPELKLPNTTLSTAQRKDYFVDGSTGVYQKLAANGTIERAILYLTMRRGGRFIYAIDVSTPTSPQVLWSKRPTDSGFSELGQTWSRPRVTLIKGYANPVVVFGAGYDPAEDDVPPTANTMGRGIFVLDAISGALLWSAGPSSGTTSCTGTTTQASCAVSGMNWSVPSDVSFVDRDNDGYTDRFYVGDMGGNIWRVDLEPGTGTGTVNTWQVSRLAALGCASGACSIGTTPRKFFFPPSVLFAPGYDLLVLSSGDRESPLSTAVTDRLFGIKDVAVGKSAGSSIITGSSLENLGTVGSSPVTYGGTLSGYYLSLASGEKGVNAPVTTRGTTFFGTNQPDTGNANTCSANLGIAKGYAVNPFTGAFGVTTFSGGGLPPTPTTGIVNLTWVDPTTQASTEIRRQFCVGCGSAVPPGTGTGTGSGAPPRQGADRTSALGAGDLSVSVPKNPKRTYWYKK